MTRLEAYRHLLKGRRLTTHHMGLEGEFWINLFPYKGKFMVSFKTHPLGKGYQVAISPRQAANHIRRNYPR